MKAALVLAPAWGTVYPPYGLAVLKSYLEGRGHSVRTFDVNLRLRKDAPKLLNKWFVLDYDFWKEAGPVERALWGENRSWIEARIREILKDGPRVVGFTVTVTNEHATLLLAKRIKEAAPDVVTVLGGPQAARMAGGWRLAAMDAVDCVVEGEGEETFTELLGVLEAGGDLATCPGLLLRRDGRVVDTGTRPLARDLAPFTHADFSDFDLPSYDLPGHVPISLSRGCPNKCNFCHEVWYWRRFRIRGAESVLDEMRDQMARWPLFDSFIFHDSLINGNMGQLREFAESAAAAGKAPRWSASAVIRKEMTPEALKLVRDSGCFSLCYGLETASLGLMAKTGKVLAKGADPDRVVRDTREAGIDTILNFMFGLPGETEEDYRETLDFVRRNHASISTVNPSTVFCLASEGTPLHHSAETFGIELAKDPLHWRSKDGTNDLPTRIERFERFVDLVHELGISCTYPYRVFYRKNALLGEYHLAKGEPDKAVGYLERALETDPMSWRTEALLKTCRKRPGRKTPAKKDFEWAFLLSHPLIRDGLETAGSYGEACAAIDRRLRRSGDATLSEVVTRLRTKGPGDDPFAPPPAWPAGLPLDRQIRVLRAVSEHVQELLPEGPGAPVVRALLRELEVLTGRQERRASVLKDLLGVLAGAGGKGGRSFVWDAGLEPPKIPRGAAFRTVLLFDTFTRLTSGRRAALLKRLAARTEAGGRLFIVDEVTNGARKKELLETSGDVLGPMERSGWTRAGGPYLKTISGVAVSIFAGSRGTT